MGLEAKLNSDGFLVTQLDAVVAWARKNSVYPMPMGISCCAIEMMASADPKYDIARFGSEVMRFHFRALFVNEFRVLSLELL